MIGTEPWRICTRVIALAAVGTATWPAFMGYRFCYVFMGCHCVFHGLGSQCNSLYLKGEFRYQRWLDPLPSTKPS